MSRCPHSEVIHPSTSNESESGFTLIEVMVTLILVSLLSFVALLIVSQIRDAGLAQRKADTVIEAEALAGSLERMVEGIRKLPLSLDAQKKDIVLRGDANAISFVGVNRLGAQTYGLVDMTIYNDLTAHKIMLEMGRRRVDPQVRGEAIDLAEDAEIRFEYLDPARDKSEPANWLGSWSKISAVPRAIRIDVDISRRGEVAHASRIAKILIVN